MQSGMKVTRDNTADLARMLKALTSTAVMVGVPADTSERTPAPGEKAEINNATIAYLMENGSPAQNIPARPHIVPGVESAEPKIVRVLKAGASHVLDGNSASVDRALSEVGQIAQSSIKAKIRSGPFAPLAPATIAARAGQRGTKRRKSENTYLDLVGSGMDAGLAQATAGIKPLINTGAYLNSITYVLRRKGS